MKRLFERPGAVFALVFAWKVALFICAAQPVPSNDSFFYDGPVVNYLLHGRYCNPALALALPISGTDVFCAYPPLYQGVLLVWMFLFGSSAISAMGLHLALFGLYLLVLLAILRQLKLPVWAVHVAGAFLLLLTFQDRPDSLAHLFGFCAVYAWVRSWSSMGHGAVASAAVHTGSWGCVMAFCGILSLCTGLQIGALYCLLLWMGTVAAAIFAKEKFPLGPMAALVLVPLSLMAVVALGLPHWWAGFLEHAQQTPSLTGWRKPQLSELLKLARTAPGVLAVAGLLAWSVVRGGLACIFRDRCSSRRQEAQNFLGGTGRNNLEPPYVGCYTPSAIQSVPGFGRAPAADALWIVTGSFCLAALAILVAAMVLVTPNEVGFAVYLQPVVVGGYLGLAARPCPSEATASSRWLRTRAYGLVALAALGSTRAIGMSTWGLACAADVGYSAGVGRVASQLDQVRPGEMVVLSAAYLYEGARHNAVRWIHSDWLHEAEPRNADRKPGNRRNGDAEAILRLKPTKLLLTQFDYYRRYQQALAELLAEPDLVTVQVSNSANVRAPDSIKALQKVVQHISWAPVIVTLTWK